jgi:hypothetical protein
MPSAPLQTTRRCRRFPRARKVTATDAVVTITAMLKAVNVQLFELGMWQAWSGR